ncbi:hypothetical protein FGL86_08670 [Pistricoccus aurantiacus]|uniref:YceI family protein n=1 Tax=Pistricoccus aurantiacus TaxID=1883414 RepID=A0A5B8SWJ0_9GAMM|nr:hypothetical protein [Pistricoccus aurantiacus]QEA39140.1 hypothetical protein FGL86_08670 [Pistricoccus aurantiacus]
MARVTRCSIGVLSLFAFTWILPVQAAWKLEPDASHVDATVVEITPEGPVPHQHRIHQLEGSIDSEGNLSMPLRLNQLEAMETLEPLPSWFSRVADRPAATVITHIPPQRLDELAVGESLTETLQFKAESQVEKERQAPVELRFTRESPDLIRVTNAQRIVLDGQQIMANSNARTILQLLGYEQLGDEIPITLEAVLRNSDGMSDPE